MAQPTIGLTLDDEMPGGYSFIAAAMAAGR
jgi:hypothetical protein